MQNYLTAEISASAVRKNLETLRGLLQPGTKLCPAVKANCYGLGIGPLLGVISELADCVAVAAPQEAIELRDYGYERPILLMLAAGAFDRDKDRHESLCELVAASVTFTLASDSGLADLAGAAADVGAEAEVHIMIDTGMGRSGVRFYDAPELIAKARAAEHIRLAGTRTSPPATKPTKPSRNCSLTGSSKRWRPPADTRD